MQAQESHTTDVMQKLRALSPQRIAEVEDFIDFLQQRDIGRSLTQVASTVSEPSFNAIWNNPDDAKYDQL